MTRPIKITPDPIIDAVVELRYESSVPDDAILGMVFPQLKDKYKEFERLPVANFPDEIRKSDPNLRHAPYYQSGFGQFKLNIGPRSIAISNPGTYVGWKKKFFPEIKELLSKIDASGIIKKYTRLGIRYIDYFDLDIYEKIKLVVKFDDNPRPLKQQNFTAVYHNGEFLTRLVVANNVEQVRVGGKIRKGSIIDTDTYIENPNGLNKDELENQIDRCHEETVQIFFDLLTKEFIGELNPEYA